MPRGIYAHKRTPPIERILRRSRYENRGYETPCLVFPDAEGYCCTNVWNEQTEKWDYIGAHVIVYEHHHGPLPEGMEPDHLCRVPACHEITHLEAVTRKVNGLRGANSRFRAHAAGTCEKDHPMSGENLYVSPGGQRKCRACMRLRKAARHD